LYAYGGGTLFEENHQVNILTELTINLIGVLKKTGSDLTVFDTNKKKLVFI
jgi:hypothetical protein